MIEERTVKLTLEGDPVTVDAIVDRLKDCLSITWQSKDQHIKLTGHVRRYLRIKPIGVSQ